MALRRRRVTQAPPAAYAPRSHTARGLHPCLLPSYPRSAARCAACGGCSTPAGAHCSTCCSWRWSPPGCGPRSSRGRRRSSPGPHWCWTSPGRWSSSVPAACATARSRSCGATRTVPRGCATCIAVLDAAAKDEHVPHALLMLDDFAGAGLPTLREIGRRHRALQGRRQARLCLGLQFRPAPVLPGRARHRGLAAPDGHRVHRRVRSLSQLLQGPARPHRRQRERAAGGQVQEFRRSLTRPTRLPRSHWSPKVRCTRRCGRAGPAASRRPASCRPAASCRPSSRCPPACSLPAAIRRAGHRSASGSTR